jgi:DNA-binding MarR family transcriptional regulator
MVKKRSRNHREVIETYRLSHLLRQTADGVYKAREAELKKFNLTPEQAGALVCIKSLGDKATPAELSRWLFRKRNSITILLNRMQRLGLINKNVNAERKNSINISLTPKGEEAYKNSIQFSGFYPIIDALPEAKRAELWDLLQEIRLRVFKVMRLDPAAYSGFLDRPIAVKPDDPEAGPATR